MRFKCNTYGCEHKFEISISENDFNKNMNLHAFDCPKCHNKQNGSYRLREDMDEGRREYTQNLQGT